MNKAKYLYGKYYQKSLNYLYPLLGYKREDVYTPAGTYLWWNGEGSIDNNQLVVVYDEVDSKAFEVFERKYLFKNPALEKCFTVEGGKVYIYDLTKQKDTVEKFLRGKYSKFTEETKVKILKYHDASLQKSVRPGRYIHMSLYPDLYYKEVSLELRNVSVETLEQVGELASVYDKGKETLNVKILGECLKNNQMLIT